MRRDDNAVLLDIAHAAGLVAEFVAGMDKAGFLLDVRTQSAVLHQILVLGEATKRLSSEFRASHSEVPWSDIAGMRDKLIHEYDAVDHDRDRRRAAGPFDSLKVPDSAQEAHFRVGLLLEAAQSRRYKLMSC